MLKALCEDQRLTVFFLSDAIVSNQCAKTPEGIKPISVYIVLLSLGYVQLYFFLLNAVRASPPRMNWNGNTLTETNFFHPRPILPAIFYLGATTMWFNVAIIVNLVLTRKKIKTITTVLNN
ncbi:MAG: hypothetical protein ACI8Z1_000577 [Candidatus Azotimanducaceae bacterium]|jgi:hypothetical protein